MIRFPIFSRAALAGATLFLGLLSNMGTSRAVEPDPDYKTLIFPSIISKAGSLAPPANAPPGDIRTNYETYYENYWTDTSYHSYDPATGAKIRGFYIDTKTYGYIHMPWPIRQITAGTTTGAGTGEPFADGNRLYSDNITIVADAADADAVWTPGESFRDDNGNGQYDEYRPAEDFWNNNNTQVLLQRRDGAGNPIGALAFPRGSYRGPVDNTAAWNATAGELYADYNDSTDLTNDTLGYDAAVNIFVAAGGAQTVVNLNELDLSPTDAASVNEGDFAHTAVADPAMLVGVPPANIPRNGVFDYTTTNADVPQVRAAAYRNGNALIVQYPSYVITNATTEAAGYVFRYADTLTVPPGAPPANAAIRTITVTVYQTGELYGLAKVPAAFPPANEYGDIPAGAGNVNLWPNTRDVLSDNTWTPARPAEPFEDYLVFGGANGAYRQDLDPAPPVRPGRTGVITQADYEAYIEWNYNGDTAALIARAGNGRYDGPEAWTEQQQTKVTVAPLNGVTTPEPLPSPIGNWGGLPFGFATWQDWWEAAFLSPAPAWGGLVANVNNYAPDAGPAANAWIPAQGWSYDSDREFCDLPSSMYHLGGDPTAVTAANYDPLQGFLRTDLAAAGLPMGDSNLGEITSPWSNNVYGQDVGPAPAPGNPDWIGPGAADNIIIAAGPFCFNIHGNNGHDAGNVLALEYMTWRTTGDRVADPDYPANLRDTNLDGFLDTGVVRQGDVFYANGGDGAGDYPYNRMRYMEDLIELWDGAQDFNDFVRPSDGVTDVPLYGYGIYEQTENPGSGGLGGPAGATTTFLTRDRVDPYDITFQIRPIDGGNLDDAVAGGTGITVSNVVTGANFAMGILCHEQGHDLLGWPDLYDYDVWNGQGATINTPIGAYDLMSGGGLVHGIPDFKAGLDGPPDPVNGLPWITPIDLTTVVPLNGGPTIVELWPGEDYHQNSFFRYRNPNAPEEYLYFYYYGNNSTYAPGAGGPGVYVTHTDNNSNLLGVPNQQRQNGHYTWEIIQADGLYHLQDGTNSGDGGDPFPGTANKRIFTEDTIPALRWWGQQEAGLRVLDIQLPSAPGQPALVTFERYQNPTSNVPYYGNDLDLDGLPDTWEVHYWGVTGIANATSDSDNDGLTDVYEFLTHTDPTKADSDLNGTPDKDEDTDSDGLLNAQEQTLGSHPRLKDTDDDGIEDGLEAAQFTSPISSISPLVERVLNLNGAPGVYAQIPARLYPWQYEYTLSATNWTVEAWAKPGVLGVAGDIIAHQIAPAKFQYRLALQADGRIALSFSPDNGGADVILTTPQPVVAGTWAHVSGSWSRPQGIVPGRLTIRVDGVVVAQMDSSQLPLRVQGAGEFVRIGQGFNGQIDDVRFWNAIPGTRTLGQLKSPLTGTETGLVAYFRFDDGTYPGSTSASTDLWTSGQIENFTSPRDWMTISARAGWPNAATLMGGATLVPSLDAPIDIDGVDSDGDGMPDGWEIANGLNPDADDAGLDPDGDGLSNQDEYLAGTNPNLIDSNGNGISDANEDSDSDGLSNAVEVSVTMTNPGVADTDDDGVSDGDEVTGLLAGAHNRVSNPLNGFDPPVRRAMRFNGNGHVIFNHQDRQNLKTWTIQAWVKPEPGADGVIISRRAGFPGDPVNPGLISYELGVKNVGGAIRPYVRYVGLNTTTFGAREILVDGTGATEVKGGSQATSQIAPLEWSHVAGTYDPDTHTLSLYINGDLSSYRTDAFEPVWLGLNVALPPTPLTVGGGESILGIVQNGFEGWLDDVAILSGALSASDIQDYASSDVSKLDLLRAGSSFSVEEQDRPVYSVDEMLAFPHRDRELLIRFKPTVNRATYPAIATAWGTAQKRAFTQMPMLAVRITDDSTMADKIAQIKADPRVEYVQPNFTREFHKTPNDSRYGEMWGLHNAGQDGGLADADIDAPEAWVKSVGNDSVTVAVIDSGCDTSHPDIAPNLWVNPGEIAGNGVDDDGNGYVDDINGYDFGDNDPNVEDSVGHGTHTAGTIGAVGNNSLGVVGVNWKTRLMILKIGAADGSLPTDAIIAAIEYAWRNGAKVSNNSYGGYFFDQAEFDAWSAANQAGHLAVCSAGNDANDNDGFLPAYPCSFTLPNIISVAATDRLDEIADFSNFGLTSVDLGAPGVDILSTLPGNYGVYSGTSMAGPHVAGVATLLMASSPGLSIDAVKQTILATVDRVESLNGLVATGGRLNASRAVGGAGTPVLFLTFDDGGVTAEDSTYSRDWAYTDPWFHAGTLVNSAFDAAEFLNSQRDTDQDGLPDWWELAVGLDPNSADGNNGGDGDLDGDGLTNSSEYLANTNPRVVDTDRDGVSDFNEDLDGDGLSNAQEQTHGTNPLLADTDDDGVNDAVEIAQSTSPIDAMDPSVDRCMQVSGNGRLKIRSEIGTDVMGSGTVELWVKSDADGQNAILVRRAEMFAFNNQRWIDYEIGLRNGIPYGLFQFRINNTQLITQRVDACRPIGREWTHIAVVRDIENDQLRILVDGAYEGQTHTVQRPPLTTYGVFETTFGGGDLVGAAVQNGFRGCLDAVRVWSYARAGYALNTQRGDRFPEFTDTGFGLSAPLRVFNFDDGGTTAENSRYVQDWLHNWQHAADLQGDAAFQLSPWHPLSYDLDDDVVADNDERLGNTSIYQSEWPYVMRALQFPGGSDLRVDERMDGVETAFYALRQYTLECWVRPEAVPAGTATLIRRFTKAGNYSTFELGLENVAGGAVPYLKFHRSDAGKTAFTMRAGYPIPVGTGSEEWTHLAATYDDDNNLVMLQVNGTVVNMSTDTAAAPYTAPAGILQLGSPEFVGSMRDVRIWSTPRTAQQIRDQREENLLFKSAEIQYSFNGDSATFLGRATSTNAVDNESSYYLDYTTAVVDGYGYNLLLGHYTQPYTLQTWVNIPAAAATDNNILIERKLPVGVTDTGQNIYATCHSIRLDGNGRPYGYWEGTLFTYVYTTVGGNPPAVALNITVEAVDNAVGSEIDLRDGQWHHLALVGDGVNVTLYVDGRAEATRPYRIIDPARQRYQSTSSFGAVLRYGETFASGRLDEGVFWNTPLSSSQINQTMSLGLTSTDISLGVRSIPDAQIPTNALVTAGVTYRNLASYLSLDGEFASPFVPDDAAPSRPYRMLPLVVGNEMIANSRPPVQIDRLRGLDDSLRGFFPGSDGGKTVENYMRRLDPSHAAFGCSIQPFRVMSEQEIACRMYDSDEDGLPDFWETMYGMDPSDATGQNGPTGDNDLDGLNNLNEYLAGTDPWDADTNRDGISDAQQDSDSDGLSNKDEQDIHHTNPGLADTDDDGFGDGNELNTTLLKGDRYLTSPLYSRSPYTCRSLVLNGTGFTLQNCPDLPESDRFDNLGEAWTVEAWIKPGSGVETGSIIARDLMAGGVSFELRLDANIPTVRFTTGTSTIVKAGGSVAIPANVWTHLAGVWDNANNTLQLYVNGVSYRAQGTPLVPKQGLGRVTLGAGINGQLDEVRIWSTARTPAQIEEGYHSVISWPSLTGSLIANFRFDDGGTTAEDSVHPFDGRLDAKFYALTGVTFASGDCIPLCRVEDDFNGNSIADWWENLFFGYVPGEGGQEDENASPIAGLGALPATVIGTTSNFWETITMPIANNSVLDSRGDVFLLKDVYIDFPSAYSNRIEELEFTITTRRDGISQDIAVNVLNFENRPANFDFDGGWTYPWDGDYSSNRESTGGNEFWFFSLKPGHNRIAIRLQNSGGGTGKSYDIAVQLTGVRLEGRSVNEAGNNKLLIPFGSDWAYFGINGRTESPAEQQLASPAGLTTYRWYERYYGMTAAQNAAAANYNAYSGGSAATGTGDDSVVLLADSDNDGLVDLYEYLSDTNPLDRDTDNDGILDAAEDRDGDGLQNGRESALGSHPLLVDTDDDGLSDFIEDRMDAQTINSLDPARGRVLSLPGDVGSFMRIPDSTEYALKTYTLDAWVFPRELKDGTVMSRAVENNVLNFAIMMTADGKIISKFTPGDRTADVQIVSPSALTIQRWSHISTTFNEANGLMSLSVNGVVVASSTVQTGKFPAHSGVGPNEFIVGRGFNGLIDEVRVWNTYDADRNLALAEAQPSTAPITNASFLLFLKQPLDVPKDGLVGYFRMDDGTYPGAVSGRPGWARGQVENFVFGDDWWYRWCHAATLNGGAILTTGGTMLLPSGDCVFLTDPFTILNKPQSYLDYLMSPMTFAAAKIDPKKPPVETDPDGTAVSTLSDTNAYWFCQSTISRSGDSAMMVGGVKGRPHGTLITRTEFSGIPDYDLKNLRLKDNQSSWMQTTVLGPGVVSFFWRASCEPPVSKGNEADFLSFHINGALKRYTSDTTNNWVKVMVDVPVGLQTLRWSYAKDRFGTGLDTADAGWVDDVAFVHTGIDTDADGLPDAYEALPAYGSNPLLADTDGDGILDADEALLGTSLTTPNLLLVGSLSVVDGLVCVDWDGLVGVKYQVQVSYDGMVTWQNAPTALSENQNSYRSVLADGPQRYCDPLSPTYPAPAIYRIVTIP